jgi:hypothetical protein
MKLIIRKQDPDDYKHWRLYLTTRGQMMADLMAIQLEEDK